MRLLALALLFLNLALWYVLSKPPEYQQFNSVATGTLPRVGSLKSPDLHGVNPFEVSGSENVIDSDKPAARSCVTVSYTHLRAHETDSYLVCRLLLEKKKKQ